MIDDDKYIFLGYVAFKSGLKMQNNPFRVNTDYRSLWQLGYDLAERDANNSN